jgi:hypothetical protein
MTLKEFLKVDPLPWHVPDDVLRDVIESLASSREAAELDWWMARRRSYWIGDNLPRAQSQLYVAFVQRWDDLVIAEAQAARTVAAAQKAHSSARPGSDAQRLAWRKMEKLI